MYQTPAAQHLYRQATRRRALRIPNPRLAAYDIERPRHVHRYPRRQLPCSSPTRSTSGIPTACIRSFRRSRFDRLLENRPTRRLTRFRRTVAKPTLERYAHAARGRYGTPPRTCRSAPVARSSMRSHRMDAERITRLRKLAIVGLLRWDRISRNAIFSSTGSKSLQPSCRIAERTVAPKT